MYLNNCEYALFMRYYLIAKPVIKRHQHIKKVLTF